MMRAFNLSLKALLFLSVLGLCPALQAAPSPELLKKTLEQVPTCGNFVRFDDQNIYLGFGYYSNGPEMPRVSAPAKVLVAPLNGSDRFELKTQDSAIDIVTEGTQAYVLTYSGIEDWDLKTKTRKAVHATHVNSYFGDEEHPQAFARYNDKIIIAHGRLGVSFFDLNTKLYKNFYQLAQNQGNLESMATGVAISGQYAYVTLDSYTLVERGSKPPFRGIVVIDMETERVVSELSGLDPGADSVVADGSKVLVSFMGQSIWKYSTASLNALSRVAVLPEPLKRMWKFPLDGRAVGAAAVDSKYYYTCFSKMPGPGEGSYFKRLPVALDRRILMLD